MRVFHRHLASFCLLFSLSTAAVARADEPPPRPAAVIPPRILEEPRAPYPAEALKQRREGVVELVLEIDEQGRVRRATVARSAGQDLDDAASEAARQFRFEPASRGGKPVASKIRYSYAFRLEAEPPAPAPSSPPPPPAPPPPPPAPPVDAPDEEIEVRGARPERAATRRTLTREETRTAPGTNGDPLKAVQNMPGLARTPGPLGALVVRGSAPLGSQVFVDGAWVPLAYHFGGLSSVIPGDMLEQIQFMPGNTSARYGRGTGGTVELKTRALRDDGRLHGVAQVDLLDARVMVEGPLARGWTVLAGARRSWIDAWIGPVIRGTGSSVRAAPYYYDYQVFAETRPSATERFRIGVYGGADAMTVLQDKIVEDDPSIAGQNDVNLGYHRVQASYENVVPDGLSSSLTMAVGRNSERFSFGRIKAHDTIDSAMFRADLSYPAGPALVLRGGADVMVAAATLNLRVPYIQQSGESSVSTFASSRWTTVRGSEMFLRPAVYAEAEIRPVSRLTAIAGLRLDHFSELHQTTLDPRLLLAYEARQSSPRTTLRASAGVAHEVPELIFVVIDRSEKIRAQRGRQISAGVEQELGRWASLSVEGYAKALDQISSRAPSSDGGTTWGNEGSGKVFGAELLLRTTDTGAFSGWLAYTISRSTRRDRPDAPEHLFEFDQTHNLTALGSYRLGRGWQVGARFRLTTGSPITPCQAGLLDGSSGAYACVPGSPFSERLPSFHQLDLRVDKTWSFSAWKLTAYLDVFNVYNRQNPEGTTYNFDKTRRQTTPGLPILPILGLRGEL